MRSLNVLRYYCSKVGKTDKSIVRNDVLTLSLRSGTGGQGLVRYNGMGGDGGSVYVCPKTGLTFEEFFRSFSDGSGRVVKATPGVSAKQVKLIGLHGAPAIVNVPVGVECVNRETRELLARCTKPSKNYLVLRGGKGGCAATNFRAEKGRHILMDVHYKLTTNVGFVGLPNAGKSTIFKSFIPTKDVKIAQYPFTTLRPQVFDVKFEKDPHDEFDDISLTIADLPGLIEGASQNRGRGYDFLKHLEYSKILMMVVDVHGFKLSAEEKYRSAMESIAVLNRELEAYSASLIKKPVILVLNKIDLNDGKEKADQLQEQIQKPGWHRSLDKELWPTKPIKFSRILPLSAISGDISQLRTALLEVNRELNPVLPLEVKKTESSILV